MNKESLIKNLINDGYLKTPLIIEAFEKIDRKDFVLKEYAAEAYEDHPLPIGFGQTISQPLTVAFMLELLGPKAGEKILDVGSGSGWKAALLGYCVGEKGLVISIERIAELAKIAEENLAKYPFLKRVVKILYGDGSKGAPPDLVPAEGFDKIIAGAAGTEIPESWKTQLKVRGRIVAPVEGSILVLDKTSKSKFDTKEHYGFSFVPLVKD